MIDGTLVSLGRCSTPLIMVFLGMILAESGFSSMISVTNLKYAFLRLVFELPAGPARLRAVQHGLRTLRAPFHELRVALELQPPALVVDKVPVEDVHLVPRHQVKASLHDRLAVIGGELLCKTLHGLEDGTVTPVKQTGNFSYAPLITAETKKISFSDTKENIINKIRGLSPVPGAIAYAEGKTVKIYSATEADGPHDGFLTVKAADGWVRITELAPEGKKRMSDEALLRGNRNFHFDS